LHARRKKLGAEEEMSYAAFKMVHSPTGVEHCAAAYLTHTAGHLDTTDIASFGPLEFGYWGAGGVSATPKEGGGGGSGSGGLPPNLVVAKANLLEVYHVRVLLEGDERTSSSGGSSNNNGSSASSVATAGAIHGTLGKTEVVTARGSSLPAAVSSVKLELACSYRLHGNVESLAVLSHRREEYRRRRDAIVLAFRDAKIAVLEFDDSTHGLCASSLHYFEGPEWQHLKRGRESFPCGPIVRADTQGRCAGVLVYTCQMVILKASQVSSADPMSGSN
jgi:cleavage and polyadenylation specificity factor subunit 1